MAVRTAHTTPRQPVREQLQRLQRRARDAELLARIDELTGLPNRRAWDEELPRMLRRACRDGRSLCVAIVDLDNFKAFNDRRGHRAGDLLLKQAGAAWSEQLRRFDLLARYGGEEFALALPGCSVYAGFSLAQRLRRAMPSGETCSIGLAEWDGLKSLDDLIERADAALYAAKAASRDCVSLAPGFVARAA